MNECEIIREELVARLDGELSPEGEARVEAHVARCPACARELRYFERTWACLATFAPVEPAPDPIGRFLDRLTREQTGSFEAAGPRVGAVGSRRWGALAAAAVLLATAWLGWRALNHGSERAPLGDPLARLSAEDRALVTDHDLPLLASEHFGVVRDMPLVEQLPVVSQLTEQDLEAM